MQFSDYLRRRALIYAEQGLTPRAIAEALADEGMVATMQGIVKFLAHYAKTGTLARSAGSGRPTKITPYVKAIVDTQMMEDDETTAVQLWVLLHSKGHTLSLSTTYTTQQALVRLDLPWQLLLPNDL